MGGKVELPYAGCSPLSCQNIYKQTSLFLNSFPTFEMLKNDSFSLSVNIVSIGAGNVPLERDLNEKRIKSLLSSRV